MARYGFGLDAGEYGGESGENAHMGDTKDTAAAAGEVHGARFIPVALGGVDRRIDVNSELSRGTVNV